MPDATCSVEGCGKPIKARGWCAAHYGRWHLYGDPLSGKPDPLRVRSVAGLICQVENCGQPVKSRDYCATHYRRWLKYGDPLAGRAVRSPRGSPCAVEGCIRPRLARGYCKPHYRRFIQYGDPGFSGWGRGRISQRPLPEDVDSNGVRTCMDCGEVKPLDDFGEDARSRSGRRRFCKRCSTQRSLAWQRANKTRAKNGMRRALVLRLYGEKGLEVEQRRIAGEGCDICGQRTVRMAIDHCHDTGRVRGLLCKDCNLILGWVRDDPARLRAMADYLERGA